MKDTFIFGKHPVLEAIRNGKSIEKLFLQKEMQNETVKELRQLCRDQSVPIVTMPKERLDKFTRGNHQGFVALVAVITYTSIDNIVEQAYEKGETPLILMLDGVTDVRNVGAIARSAVGMGVHALVVPAKGSARINADAVKTSAGAILNIPICRVHSLPNTLRFLTDSGLVACCATGSDGQVPAAAHLTAPLVLIMGDEGEGVSPMMLKASKIKLSLPMNSALESYNVSAATAMLLYEINRQRTAE